jgi:hypothetical protein
LNAPPCIPLASEFVVRYGEMVNGIPIVLISSPDKPPPEDVCANVFLTLPFTERKLQNRIKPLVTVMGYNMLHVGAIRLDMERKRYVAREGKPV